MTVKVAYLAQDDRRTSLRTPYYGIIDVVIKGSLYKEEAVNISDAGVFFRSGHPENYHVFDDLTLSFQLPDLSPVKHSGTVVRVTDSGIAVLYNGIECPDDHWLCPQIAPLFESL